MVQKMKPSLLSVFEPRILTIFLIIAIPITLIGALFILGLVRSEINKSVGRNLAETAADTSRYLESLTLHYVTNVSVMAVTPLVVEAAIAANRQHPSDFQLVQERLRELDREWRNVGGSTELALEIVGRDTSVFLREVEAFNPNYKEIILTDERGAVIAATNLTSDYLQADEQWWQQAYGDGETGAIFVSNVLFDESAKAYGIEVAVPVREKDEENGTVVAGILKALIEAADLFSAVGTVQVGSSGHAVLLNASDGTIIIGDDPAEVMKQKYPCFILLQEAIGDDRRSFVCQHDDGRNWLVGFSPMPQPNPFPELNWRLLVEQTLDEAQAPTSSATKYMVTFFVIMLLMVLLFSLYMHFRLVRPVRDVELRKEMEGLAGADPE
jgi:hypothetical protein